MEQAEPTERSPLVGETGVSTSATARRLRDQNQIRPYGVLALLIFIVSIILIIVFFPHNHPESGVEDEIISPHELTENIFQHLNAFNLIAQGQEHDLSRGKSYSSLFTVVNNSLFDKENYATFGDLPRPSRSIINGYNESATYITDQLKKHTQCNVKLQSFKVPIWQMFKEAELNVTFAHENDINMVGDEKENYAKKSAALAYQSGVDFRSMRYGGQSARLEDQHVFYVNEFGCSDYGWVGIENKVALIQEGGKCGFWDAAYRAEKKGATAVIFFNSPNRKGLILSRVRLSDWQEGDPLMTIPVIAASYSLGQLLIYAKNVRVDLQTFTNIKVVDTYNIICDLNDKGRKEDTIVLGAHLDSVPTGPGIVDNASGSSVLLEILLALERAYFKPKNHLVFAWWAAEEIGLLGSRHYVRELIRKGENDNVAMNLNFDMLGSPNFVPFILQGEDAPSDIRNASIKIRNMFQAFFVAARTPYGFTDMISGSDFLPFLQHGIPSGGIFTGAGDIKSEDQRRTFGGLANAPYDPCYHQACDTIENVSHEAIETMAQAALFAITRFSKKVNLRQYLGAPEVDE